MERHIFCHHCDRSVQLPFRAEAGHQCPWGWSLMVSGGCLKTDGSCQPSPALTTPGRVHIHSHTWRMCVLSVTEGHPNEWPLTSRKGIGAEEVEKRGEEGRWRVRGCLAPHYASCQSIRQAKLAPPMDKTLDHPLKVGSVQHHRWCTTFRRRPEVKGYKCWMNAVQFTIKYVDQNIDPFFSTWISTDSLGPDSRSWHAFATSENFSFKLYPQVWLWPEDQASI